MGKLVFATFPLVAITSANLILPFVQPTCDYLTRPAACLRGQICTENNICGPVSANERREACTSPPLLDGRCGSEFDGACCDAEGLYGPCCSQHGWCGKTPEHCLPANGCQTGCTTDTSPSEQSSSRSMGSPSVEQTSTAPLSEPVIGRPTQSASGPVASGPVTTDGMCGATHGGTTCGNWSLGSCCSIYGFCGNTSAHCGQGCQSGPCDQSAESPPPAPLPAPLNENPGSVKTVGDSAVPAMHAALMPNGKVVFLDKVENYTKLDLANGRLAYSSEYDPTTNEAAALAYKTNAFCSGGSFLANGTLVNVGGNAPLTWLDPTIGDGFRGFGI